MSKVLHRLSVTLTSGKELFPGLHLCQLLAEDLPQDVEDAGGSGPLGGWLWLDLFFSYTFKVED